MKIVEINDELFNEVVLKEKKVLVDFYANWCGPCRMLRPILDSVAEELNKKIVSINIDDNSSLAEKYNVSSIPCLVLFENGKETKRSVGLISKDEVIDLIGE